MYRALEDVGWTCVGITDGVDVSQGGPNRDGAQEVDRSLVDRVCDLRNANECRDVFEGCSHVLHLAADGRPDAPFDEILRTNIIGTQNVLEAAANTPGVKRVVFASSNHTQHGLTFDRERGRGPESLDISRLNGRKMTLSDVAYPDSYYAVSKLCGEDLGRLYSTVWKKFEFVSLRIGWCLYDDPSELRGTEFEPYLRSMFLSRRDCVGFVRAALETSLRSEYTCAYAISDNSTAVFDLRETIDRLGYIPVDSSDNYFE